MTQMALLVLSGMYDELTDQAHLYVQPVGTSIKFTVTSLFWERGEELLRAILGKVITDLSISSSIDCSISPYALREKSIRFGDGSTDSLGPSMTEDLLVLTGRYLEDVIVDGEKMFVFDSVFKLILSRDFDIGQLGAQGEWFEIEMTMMVSFEKVVTMDQWVAASG